MSITEQRKKFLRAALRRLWLKWPPRNEVKKKARLRRGIYLCAGVGRAPHEARAKAVQVDHVKPIGELKDWNSWITKLFCSANNLQVLCLECHRAKTAKES